MSSSPSYSYLTSIHAISNNSGTFSKLDHISAQLRSTWDVSLSLFSIAFNILLHCLCRIAQLQVSMGDGSYIRSCLLNSCVAILARAGGPAISIPYYSLHCGGQKQHILCSTLSEVDLSCKIYSPSTVGTFDIIRGV